jgi:hypothetical protein
MRLCVQMHMSLACSALFAAALHASHAVGCSTQLVFTNKQLASCTLVALIKAQMLRVGRFRLRARLWYSSQSRKTALRTAVNIRSSHEFLHTFTTIITHGKKHAFHLYTTPRLLPLMTPPRRSVHCCNQALLFSWLGSLAAAFLSVWSKRCVNLVLAGSVSEA